MASPTERVAVRLFGPLELRGRDTVLGPRDLGGVKPKQLLEVLLLERGRSVAKDRIAELLWGDREPPRRVFATIETYVSVLRRRLLVCHPAPGQMIVTEPGGYRIVRAALDCDADRFERLLRRAAAASGADRRSGLETAVDLGELDLVADEPYAAWAIPTREHYRERHLQALVELAECCLDLGDAGAAVVGSRRALEHEPTRERACRALMRAQRALGDRDGALRAYESCRSALAEGLGVAPAATTAALQLAILRDEAPAETVRAPISYARNGSIRIAYQSAGVGALDLVFSPSNVSNLGVAWDDPTYAAFLRRLASMSRLILFDKRGTGLSDPALEFPTTRERSEDVLAVLDAVGSEQAVLFGVCGGGALCMQFAADHPDRAAGLILHNSTARMLVGDGYPWGWTPELYERFLEGFEGAWMGDGSGLVRRNPGLADNPRYRDWFARYVRLGANPWMARRLSEMNAELDVRAALDDIRAPCLVICRTDDVWLSAENSRYLARRIKDAELVELAGVDHDPWVGDSDEVLDVVARFLGELPSSRSPASASAR